MKLFIKSTLIITFFILSGFMSAQELNLSDFVNEVSKRQSRVEEFRVLKNQAKILGIKNVYMFGGTAAAWAHYVRWDMRRELGIEDLQAERFDYDYTNIFRANQDFDVVVDGTAEQAEALEKSIQSKFNYFSGKRSTWEVRLLNEQRADKESILGFDFQNQHTDSHSTGLINIMKCKTGCILDVRDMNASQGQFLRDVFEAKLRFYYSNKHKETNRYKKKLNPPILSVVRYFTKAVQYGLEMREDDVKVRERIINNFKKKNVTENYYVKKWLEKNAKKLIVNAIDIEYASDLINKVGLKDVLISSSDKMKDNSMSWWLNKEPLRTKAIGKGTGKRAIDLFTPNSDGQIIVAHETNSFSAFESITKSHSGYANVLISREQTSGEAAVYGNGHYVRLGRIGARGTGLTIRYVLNPEARDKSDFTVHRDYLVIKNKAAIEVIYEHLNLSAKEYFHKLLNGLTFDENDKGVLEKLKRRVFRELNVMNAEESQEIASLIKKSIESGKYNHNAITEWFQARNSIKHIDVLDALYSVNKYDELKKYFDNNRHVDYGRMNLPHTLAHHVYSQVHWVREFPNRALEFWKDFSSKSLVVDYTNVLTLDIWKTQYTKEFIETLFFYVGIHNTPSIEATLQESSWVKQYLEKNPEVLEKIFNEGHLHIVEPIIKHVFTDSYWQSKPDVVLKVLELNSHSLRSELVASVFSKTDFWYKKYPKLINELLLNDGDYRVWNLLTNSSSIDWKKHPFDFSALFKSNNGEARQHFITFILAKDIAKFNLDEISRFYRLLNGEEKKYFVSTLMIKNNYYSKNELLDLILKDSSEYSIKAKKELFKSVLSLPYFENNKYLNTLSDIQINLEALTSFFQYVIKNDTMFIRLEKYIDKIMSSTHLPNYSKMIDGIGEYIMKYKSSAKYDHWIDNFLQRDEHYFVSRLIDRVLTLDHWSQHPRIGEWIHKIIDKQPDLHYSVVTKLISKHGLGYVDEVEKLILLKDEHTSLAIAELFVKPEWRTRTDIFMKVYDQISRNGWSKPENFKIVASLDEIKPLIRAYKADRIKNYIKKAAKKLCSNIYL